MRRRWFLGAALVSPLAAPFAAHAESWPAKPIRVILPGPAGGLIDVGSRAVSEALQRELGQTWLIDPRPGGNGIVGAQMMLSAPPDGYTLYQTVSGHVALSYLVKTPFDVIADFQPIAMIGVSTAIVCAPPESPASDIASFVAHARKNPGKLNYLNSGNGTSTHLVPEQLKLKFGIDVTSISYKGLPPGVQDLLANRLDLAVVSTSLVMSHVKAGRLKALAVIGPKRLDELPQVATMTEQGVGDAEVRSWLPLYGQRALPRVIVDRVNAAMAAALADRETQARLAAAYITPAPMTPEQVGVAMEKEHDRLGKLIRQLGITADGAS
jgi:tripartite-type tricarboxylate transporter receptor subunit TctC